MDSSETELIGSITSHKGKLFATTYSKNLVVSTDGGKTFTDIKDDALNFSEFMVSANNRLYNSTRSSHTGGGEIGFTTDEGQTWTSDTVGLPNLKAWPGLKPGAMDFFTYEGGKRLFCYLRPEYGCYQKAVSDKVWTKTSSIPQMDIPYLQRFTYQNDTLFAVNDSSVFMSTNNGNTWTALPNKDLPPLFIPGFLHKTNKRLYLMAEIDQLSRQNFGIYYTDDLGKNWDTLVFKHLLQSDRHGQMQRPINMMAHGPDIWISLKKLWLFDPLQIIASHDAGETFSIGNKGMLKDYYYDGFVKKFEIFDGKLFALSVRWGVYSQPLSLQTDVQEFDYNQFTAYPNPAHDYLRISSKNGQCSVVSFYNLAGKRVMEAPFNESELINISELQPGFYIARVGNAHFRFLKE